MRIRYSGRFITIQEQRLRDGAIVSVREVFVHTSGLPPIDVDLPPLPPRRTVLVRTGEGRVLVAARQIRRSVLLVAAHGSRVDSPKVEKS